MKEIAKKHNKTPAQILLRFLVQHKIVVIPKSTNPQRLRQNIEVRFIQIAYGYAMLYVLFTSNHFKIRDVISLTDL